MFSIISSVLFFFFNDTATTEIYTLSLHDALPITRGSRWAAFFWAQSMVRADAQRSEEHTSELQSPYDLVCSLLLEKKKKPSRRVRHGQVINYVCSSGQLTGHH